MKEVKLAVTINWPAREVFEFATNPKNTPKWLDVVVEETNEWPVKLGTIYRNRGAEGGWSEYEVTAWEPNKMFVFSKKGDTYHVKYTFTPLDKNTTEMEYHEWMDEGELEDPFTQDILQKFKEVTEQLPLAAEKITTESFELAVYAKGDPATERLALVLPGLLDTKDYPHMRGHVDYLASRGCYAITFDPPGTWESAGDISQYTATNYLKAVDELIAKFDKPAFVMGHSFGGYLSMLASVRNARIFAIAPIMAPSSMATEQKNEAKIAKWKAKGIKVSRRDLPNEPKQSRQFDLPFSFREDAVQYDARDGLDTLLVPKLFIVGEHDTTVLPEESKGAYEIAAEPKQLVMLDSDHDYRYHPALIEQVNQILGTFLNEIDNI